MSLYDELAWRGLVHQTTDSGLAARLGSEVRSLYIGFDPSAPSLHLGSLVPLLTLMRAERHGIRPIVLVGGATGMIGDPSGKSEERRLLGREVLDENVAALRRQIGRFLDFGPEGALLVDNYEWFAELRYLDFLRHVGKLFSVNMMLGKESVRARLEEREQGISYTEFSYMLVQAYDFLVLHDRYDCRLQLGGSDQWGNITAGIDLIRRARGREAYGATTPLVLTSSGHKFGKSEKGTVWLDAERTSPFEFFQFLLRTEDRDVVRFLRYFTFFDEATIAELEHEAARAPEKREAQRQLARELTLLVHGKEAAAQAEEAGRAIYQAKGIPSAAAVGAPTMGLPATTLALPAPLVDALVETGLCKSKGEARRALAQGGVYVNGERQSDERALTAADLDGEGRLLLQRGKRDKHVIVSRR